MCAEALSQEEIDALLRGETPPPPPSSITPEEEDTIQEYAAMLSESGRDVFSTLLGEETSLETGEFAETDTNTIDTDIDSEDIVVAELHYKGLAQGKSLVIMSVDNALKMAAQMTGGGADTEFGDLEESAFSEAIQSLFSSVNTQLASKLGGEISLEPPDITTRPEDLSELMPDSPERQILLTHRISAGDISGPIYQIIPKNLLHSMSTSAPMQEAVSSSEHREFGSQTALPVMDQPAQFMSGPGGGMDFGQKMAAPPGLNVDISNLNLILDISVEVKVELGRTHRKIREVLELGPGSVVELDRLAGEPVDILVNDKLFAKGEVVVIDENFGVRITDILSIEERIEALK
jgi:flagellar motor switch protein FliN